MKTQAITHWAGFLAGGIAALLAVLAPSAHAAAISEPATVFYGKVIVTDAVRPYLLTEGTLLWTIEKSGGGTLALRATLREVNEGEFSYRLNVPHEALLSGLPINSAALPLGAVAQTHAHGQITVQGLPARRIGPAGGAFDAAQALRTAAYRMDLLVSLNSEDLDGDGLPDWWETRFTLDDPNADPDGDGLNNLAEHRRGTNPRQDDRVPSLATKEVRAVADGTSLVLLQAVDSDSAPAALLYTVTRVPDSGVLYLRNASASAANPDAALNLGDTFTQADIEGGKIIFADQSLAGTVESSSFQVTLQDENPAHALSTNTVRLQIYRPRTEVSLNAENLDGAVPKALPSFAGFTAEEDPYLASHALSRDWSYVVADGSAETRNLQVTLPSSTLNTNSYATSYIPSYGPDRCHFLIGGGGNDRLVGSMESDVISGGPGADVVRGNGGADLFVLASRYDGNDTIEDFNPAENDRIDLSRVLVGTSKSLTNYVRVINTPSNSILQISCTGSGAVYGDLALTLSGPVLAQQGLASLVESGHVITGDKAFAPRVSIVATIPVASENGPSSGEFRLTRTGSLDAALVVNLQITGPAGNGTDYFYLSPQVTFPAGQRTLTLTVIPYADANTELNEVVDIVVLGGAAYEAAATAHAQVTIEDLKPLISIEALEPLALKSDLTPGYFLITRESILDRSVFVQLTVSGTAANGTDYQSIPAFVNLAPFQTTALIAVTPKSTAILSNGLEYVQLLIRTNAAYKVSNVSSARVMILEQQMSFNAWQDRFFPGASSDLTAFGNLDSGFKGIRNLHRYAFGLDPSAPQLSRGAPEFKIVNQRLTVAFRRPYSVVQVQYAVEVSDDLVTWHSGDQWWEQFTAPEHANDVEIVSYRSKQTVSDTPKLFMRVRVAYAP